jgi:hypothetical protein
VIGMPAGAHLPRAAEPLKLAIGVFVLISATLLLFGFKLKGKSHGSRTAAVGGIGVAMARSRWADYRLHCFTAEGDRPHQMRASVIAYFFLLDIAGSSSSRAVGRDIGDVVIGDIAADHGAWRMARRQTLPRRDARQPAHRW